jgi:hypothetical protein
MWCIASFHWEMLQNAYDVMDFVLMFLDVDP